MEYYLKLFLLVLVKNRSLQTVNSGKQIVYFRRTTNNEIANL